MGQSETQRVQTRSILKVCFEVIICKPFMFRVDHVRKSRKVALNYFSHKIMDYKSEGRRYFLKILDK